MLYDLGQVTYTLTCDPEMMMVIAMAIIITTATKGSKAVVTDLFGSRYQGSYEDLTPGDPRWS